LKPNPSKLTTCQAKVDAKLGKDFVKAAKVGPCDGPSLAAEKVSLRAFVRDQLEILRFGRGFIETPPNGNFTNAGSVAVTGGIRGTEAVSGLDLNGVPQTLSDPDKTFSTSAALSPAPIFNPIIAEVTAANGDVRRDRVTLVVGDGVNSGFVLDGAMSAESLGMRFTNTGLGQVTPIVQDMAAGAFDIGGLLTAQNPVLDDECVAELGGLCLYFATVDIVEVGFSNLALDIESIGPGEARVTTTIDDFAVEINLHIRDQVAVSFDCGLEISTASSSIEGTYDLEPDATNPSKVDVNQIGPVAVTLGGFESEFISGICDDPIIGDIIQGIVGSTMQSLVQDGFSDNLADPDGAGPSDSPIADGIETALDGIDIAGPVGQSIGVDLNAAFSAVDEDANGVTFAVDAAITAGFPDPLAPDLPASYAVAEPFPVFGATTPVGGDPYGIALALSTSAFNQLLKAEIESGLLRADITEFDLGGGPLTLTAGLLQSFVPELSQFPPTEEIVIEARPELAPIVSGESGPGGELTEMRISHLLVNMRLVESGLLLLSMAVDATVGVDLDFDAGGVGFSLGNPAPEDIGISILTNTIDADEAGLESFMASIMPFAFPELAGALGGLPLPSFLGLVLEPVEVSKQGDFLSIFANLGADPTQDVIANVVTTDLSSADSKVDGAFDVNEWRHKITTAPTATTIDAALRGMVGADACCTVEDETRTATAHYRINFDVESDENWVVDVDHSIIGAFGLLDEKVALEDAGGSVSIGTVEGTYKVDGGSPQSFDFDTNISSVTHALYGGEGDTEEEFFGGTSTQIAGSGDASIELEFMFTVQAFSNSNAFFPAAGGDEVCIRFGRSDTIDNGFTCGQYPSGDPSLSVRDPNDDGHFVHVELTTTP
jgi:hypothetical protein